MNFDVIKSILPDLEFELNKMKEEIGVDKTVKRVFGCMTKVIRILAHNSEGVIILERKKKEKRVIGFNNVITKCKKIIKKQTNKIERIERKIQEVNSEPDYIEEPTPNLREAKVELTLDTSERQEINKLRDENQELRRANQLISVEVMMLKTLRQSVAGHEESVIENKETIDHPKTTGGETRIYPMSVSDMMVQTESQDHNHSIACPDCSKLCLEEREKHFGDKKSAMEVMQMLGKHNFMQPNKHETILLVKKAMLIIKNNINQKFSRFLSEKMTELCDLLLLTFTQFQKIRDDEQQKIIEHLKNL